HHQLPIVTRKLVEAQVPTLHGPGPEILQNNIGACGKVGNQLLPARLPRVDLHRFLVPGDHGPPERFSARFLPTPFPHRVTDTGLLDLDHLGAEVSKDLPAERAGQKLTHLYHPQTRERSETAHSCHHSKSEFHAKFVQTICFDRTRSSSEKSSGAHFHASASSRSRSVV